MQASNLPAFPHLCLYAGDFNCRHVTGAMIIAIQMVNAWLSGPVPTTSPCYIAPRRPPVSTLAVGKQTPTQILQLDFAFASVDLDSRLPDRRILGKFPRSQHRPSLISPPKLAHPKPSKPAKQWNFRKANWDHYANLTNKLAKSIPPPESHNIDQVYQCFCKVISTAAKKCILVVDDQTTYLAGMRSVKTSISISCSHLGALILIGLPQPYSQGSMESGEIAGQRRSATLTFRTPAGWHGIL